MRSVPQPRGDLLAEGSQEELQVQGLRVRQVQPHPGEAEGHGSPGTDPAIFNNLEFLIIILQVALKRQQAAEDALALNMRSVASGEAVLALPEGPIVGLPCSGVRAPETNAERRIKGEALPVNICSSSIDLFICRGVRILQEPDQHRLPQSSPRGGGPGDQHHTQCPGPGAPDQPQPPRPVQAPGHGGQRHRDRGHCGPGGRGGGGRQARPEVIWRSAPCAQLLPRDAEADAPPHVQTLPPLPPHTQPASLLQQPLWSEIIEVMEEARRNILV